MTNKWQPKDGDWIYHEGRMDGRELYKHDGVELSLKALSLCRPAVLSDFAVEIPTREPFCKIYVVEERKDCHLLYLFYDEYTRQSNVNTIIHEFKEYQSIVNAALYEAFIAHYNITVLDAATFKKLSEADNG